MMKEPPSYFIVIAFRYGGSENTFPIGVFASREKAEQAAKEHRDYRGGKYEHRVYRFSSLEHWDDNIGHSANNKPTLEK